MIFCLYLGGQFLVSQAFGYGIKMPKELTTGICLVMNEYISTIISCLMFVKLLKREGFPARLLAYIYKLT